MLVVKDLEKKYGNLNVLSGISFSIERNGIYGLLGPNGAGKTTLLRILTGFLYQTSGTVIINGYDLIEDTVRIKKITGYLPENAPVDKKLTVFEYLFFIASLKGLKGEKRKKEIERVCDLCGLNDDLSSIIGLLSKGFRQRVGLAQALLNNPLLLLLDEPMNGLDPEQKIHARKIIKNIGESHTVILSTHLLENIKSICSRIFIIKNGKLITDTVPDSNLTIEDFYLKEIGSQPV